MIAAHHGIKKPRRYFDFLMGFTYGASYRSDFGFITVGTDPETGLLTAAPYLGLVRRYYFTDEAGLYLRALRSYLTRGYPIRVPLDMGALYGQAEPLPHNEVLVGYDAGGFTYCEPVSRPPAPSQPGHLPPGEQGLYVTDERLLQAVRSESELFGYPWHYPLVIFEPGDRSDELGPVWRQNGQALVRGRRWGQTWGAAAIEQQAGEIERRGECFDFAQIALGLEVGAATRPDNAAHLRETFADRRDLHAGRRFLRPGRRMLPGCAGRSRRSGRRPRGRSGCRRLAAPGGCGRTRRRANLSGASVRDRTSFPAPAAIMTGPGPKYAKDCALGKGKP